jgi:hypothetical protein
MQQESNFAFGLSIFVVSVTCFFTLKDLGNSCLGYGFLFVANSQDPIDNADLV